MRGKNIKILVTIFCAIVLMLFTPACESSEKPGDKEEYINIMIKTESKSPEPSEERRKFAIVFAVSQPFFDPVAIEAERFAIQNGWDVVIKAPDMFNVKQQIQIVESLITMRVDGIAIGATDPDALVPYIDEAIEKGIKVIALETDSPNSKRLGYMGTDNFGTGKHLAHVLARILNSKGKVLVLTGLPTQLSLNQRIEGIKQVIKEEYPGIEIISLKSSYGDPKKAIDIIEEMVEEHPDFDAFVGIDAAAGPAAVTVWKAKGWTKDDKVIVTYENIPENIQGLSDGIITSIISQMQHKWGASILAKLNSLCNGEEILEYDNTGSIEINMDNVDIYINKDPV